MKKNVVIILMLLFPLLGNQNYANYNEEELAVLKERALNEATQLMMQEIINITKDIQINSSLREELIENVCSTAAMNNFTVNADVSDDLVQEAGDFSGSIFVSRDGQSTWVSSSEVTLIGTEGYENTWATSVPTSGGNNLDWYLSGLVNSEVLGLDYGTLVVSQAPNNTYNNSSNTTYATIVNDVAGDASASYDIQSVSGAYSAASEEVDNLLFSLDLTGECCNEGGFFGPWYLYGIGIVNPDSQEALSAYAIGYGDGGFGQLVPGLYKIAGDFITGEIAGFELLTEISTHSQSGNELHLSVNADYLFNDSDFGEWPNSLEGLVLVGVTVEASLDGLDVAAEVLDQTNVGIILLNSQHQDGNSLLFLSNPNFNVETNVLSVTYSDADNNLPWYKAAQICHTPENGGGCFEQIDMLPESHNYSEGVVFNAEITEEIFTEWNLSGDYEAHFWFADSEITSYPEAQIAIDITIGDGNNCGLAGNINGDYELNVLDIVLLVNLVIAESYDDCADLNSDGSLNVLDIVNLVNLIILTP